MKTCGSFKRVESLLHSHPLDVLEKATALAKAGFEIITITIKENNIKQHSVCIIKE